MGGKDVKKEEKAEVKKEEETKKEEEVVNKIDFLKDYKRILILTMHKVRKKHQK
jgi:hypothetical protein